MSLVLAVLFPEVELDLDAVLGIVCLALVALLYLGAVYSLGIFVSARTQLVSTSITVLLLVWVGLILAYPNMAPYIAAQLLPAPSRQTVERQKNEIERDMRRRVEALARTVGLMGGCDAGELLAGSRIPCTNDLARLLL